MWKEFLVLIFGPLTQLAFYYIIYIIYTKGFIDIRMFNNIKLINGLLLKFNLLPIVPLDGGKLLNIILNLVFKYKFSNKLTIYISYITIIIELIFEYKTIIKIMLILILFKVIKEHKNLNYKYNKFILERQINTYNFKRKKLVNNINSLYRSRYHYIKNNKTFIDEKEYLTKYSII